MLKHWKTYELLGLVVSLKTCQKGVSHLFLASKTTDLVGAMSWMYHRDIRFDTSVLHESSWDKTPTMISLKLQLLWESRSCRIGLTPTFTERLIVTFHMFTWKCVFQETQMHLALFSLLLIVAVLHRAEGSVWGGREGEDALPESALLGESQWPPERKGEDHEASAAPGSARNNKRATNPQPQTDLRVEEAAKSPRPGHDPGTKEPAA